MWQDHVGIPVSDLSRAIDFYSRLLGVAPLDTAYWDKEASEYLSRMVGQEDIEVLCAFFELAGSPSLLELVEYRNLGRSEGNVERQSFLRPGNIHLALAIDDIDEGTRRLLEAGGEAGEIVDISYGPYAGGRSVYGRDPDGTPLQLMELASRPGKRPLLRNSASTAPYQSVDGVL